MATVKDNSVTKEPKTIKVSTILKAFALVIIIILSVVFGWVMRSDADSAYHANVMSEAQALVTRLK